MPRFSESFVNRVAQANDIVDVVGQYVALKKGGREFTGLCPFHEDHRPSMHVSPAKQIFKCFVCGAGGGVFQFVMQYQKQTFPEAVRQLADRAGIPLPQDDEPAAQADRSLSKQALTRLMTFAARYFRDRLMSQTGRAALAYARQRQLTDASIGRFGLGFAPDSWDALQGACRRGGFTDRQMVAAGLAGQRDDGTAYDRFRNRLIFPILDVTGKVIAFGGRAMNPDDPAKYLNSPETPLFDKSANLYALNWTRQAIVETRQAVVVEGYLDALMCVQEGVGNVVATLGTALTRRHVRMLSRFADDVVLVFDADTAGHAAADRAIELFLAQRVDVRVATLPQGPDVKDPCDYVLAAGGEALRRLLALAPDALAYAWSRRRQAYRAAATLAEKGALIEDFLRLIVSSATYGMIDPLRQGLLVGHLSELIGLRPEDVSAQMRRAARRVRRPRTDAAPEAGAAAGRAVDPTEGWILGALLCEPGLFESARERVDPEAFADPALKALAERVWELAAAGRLELPALLETGGADDWGRLVTDLQYAAENRGNHQQTLADAIDTLLRRRRREAMDELKARRDTDSAEVTRRIAEDARTRDVLRHPRAPRVRPGPRGRPDESE